MKTNMYEHVSAYAHSQVPCKSTQDVSVNRFIVHWVFTVPNQRHGMRKESVIYICISVHFVLLTSGLKGMLQ